MLHSTENVIRHKIGLLNLAEELDNVSRACRIMGVSRDTFYRYKEAVESNGVEALIEKSRRKPNPKNRIDAMIEQAVVDYALEQPAHGQVRAGNELRKRGIFVSPTGVRGAWLRNDLGTFKKRLRALEAKAAAEGLVYAVPAALFARMEGAAVLVVVVEELHPGAPPSYSCDGVPSSIVRCRLADGSVCWTAASMKAVKRSPHSP